MDRKIDKKIDLIIAKRAKCLTDYDLVRYRLVDKIKWYRKYQTSIKNDV